MGRGYGWGVDAMEKRRKKILRLEAILFARKTERIKPIMSVADAIKKTKTETSKHILQYIKNKDWIPSPVLFTALEKKHHHGSLGIADELDKLKARGLIEIKITTKRYGKYGKGIALIREKKVKTNKPIKTKVKTKKRKKVKSKTQQRTLFGGS